MSRMLHVLARTRPRAPGRTVAIVGLLTGAVLVGACGDDDDSTSASGAPSASDLEGKTFVSTAVDGETLVSGSEIVMTFEDGSISVIAGCNTLFGGFAIEAGELRADTLASTQMACADELMQQDEWLSALLQGSPVISLDGGTLSLVADGMSVTFAEES